ncbi:drosha [Trypoxylus dichotomus]
MSNYESNGNGNWYYNGSYYPPHPTEQPPSEYEWGQCQVPPPYPNFSVPPPNYSDNTSGYSYPPPTNNVDYNYYQHYNGSSNSNTYPYYNMPQDTSNYATYSSSGVYDYSQELDKYKTEQSQEKPTENDVQNNYDSKYSDRQSRSHESKKSCSRRLRSASPHSRHKSGRHKSRKSRSRSRHRTSPERSKSVKSWNSDSSKSSLKKVSTATSEREMLLSKWRKNYCATREEVTRRIEELNSDSDEDILEKEKKIWTRTTPADLYYQRDEINPKVIRGTERLLKICETFKEELVLRAKKINAIKPVYEPPPRKNRARICKHKSEQSSSDSSEEELTDEEDCTMEELTRKQQHPDRLHPEMWYNDIGEMNDGPLCRCSKKSRKSGIRHGIYPGEKFLKLCNLGTNNGDKLFHYRITISPPTNFLIKTPTIIQHDEHEFIFEGFSMFSHFPLGELPTCKVIRFNIEYTILYIDEKIPDNFTVHELDLFHDYLFTEILELVDLDFKAAGDRGGCSQFHFMPRFVRELPDNGKEILSMKEVLQYLLNSSVPLIKESELQEMINMTQYEWQTYADEIKGMVVTYPGKKPCSVRVDQLDRNIDLQTPGKFKFPEIVHFGIRPPQLSYAGNPEYQKAWRDYVKFRHLLANMSKPTFEDRRKLEVKENKLQEMRTQSKMKRDVTVAVSAEGFYRTGIMCDVIQHAMLIPVLVCHLRFHHSLNVLEESMKYKFKNRALLQLALTHPSYRENFGTNPDHARNSLTNCGIRQPEYGDRRIHYMNTRKRGINTLINIMSRFGRQHETESNITHNERLEFLGDAVVEFLSSIHLFYTFPDLEEGGLATYRAAIVQNQHLAVLARTLNLDQFMLYAHGSDLCHDLELRHAMANCFEALMGALFLDGGIDIVDRVFSETLFKSHPDLLEIWTNLPPHPLQEKEPLGDRLWIPKFELLQKLTRFEESIGVEFTHIRLLARAFTDRSVGYTNLTLGSNQRLEFLGDTVLQLIASEYLYKYFPEHHEGHLSLLRSSLVNNRTQAVVCDDLGMANYALYNNPKAELKTKDRADLLEAFIGALYVDKGLEYCEVFCQVTLFPRLQDFIMNQDWNDPKSKLQQCCLTLRTMDGGEPDIPVYKVIECKGPTNTRVYTVAVYFRGTRLASAVGHSIQQAEMNAAKKALEISHDLFPQLDHQKRVIAKSMKKQRNPKRRRRSSSTSTTTSNSTNTFQPTRPKSPTSYSRNRFRPKSPSRNKDTSSSSS